MCAWPSCSGEHRNGGYGGRAWLLASAFHRNTMGLGRKEAPNDLCWMVYGTWEDTEVDSWHHGHIWGDQELSQAPEDLTAAGYQVLVSVAGQVGSVHQGSPRQSRHAAVTQWELARDVICFWTDHTSSPRPWSTDPPPTARTWSEEDSGGLSSTVALPAAVKESTPKQPLTTNLKMLLSSRLLLICQAMSPSPPLEELR